MLPSAKLMVGYFDAGPASTSVSGLDLLNKPMMSEDKAFAAESEDAVDRFYHSFKEVNLLNASMCVNDRYIDRKNNFLLSEYKTKADQCIAEYPTELGKEYQCFMNASQGCERTPTDHQSGHLREYYSYLRNHMPCLTMPAFRRAHPFVGDPDSVLRLIYWDRVWANFLHNDAKQMTSLNSLLKAAGAPQSLQFKLGPSASRKDFLNWEKDVNGWLAKRSDPFTSTIKNHMSNLDSAMGNLNRWWVPDSWLTASSHEQGHYPFKVEAKCE
jgi:hypothetical protein